MIGWVVEMSKALALREAKTEYADHASWFCVDCGSFIEPLGDGTYPEGNRCWSCQFDRDHPMGVYVTGWGGDIAWDDWDLW